jgi:hypothetical protein
MENNGELIQFDLLSSYHKNNSSPQGWDASLKLFKLVWLWNACYPASQPLPLLLCHLWAGSPAQGYCKFMRFSLSLRTFIDWHLTPVVSLSRSQQRTGQRFLILTLKFLALKKAGFLRKKKLSNFFFTFFNLYSMQLSSADATIFSKKN